MSLWFVEEVAEDQSGSTRLMIERSWGYSSPGWQI